jgi:hypothetical protein
LLPNFNKIAEPDLLVMEFNNPKALFSVVIANLRVWLYIGSASQTT